MDTEADVTCPYCAQTVSIRLDPGGGAAQDYVEDCEVCCQPWRVRVSYDAAGQAAVSVDRLQ
ncbi:MAG TPA: CPXCG motif-containing cysteine-rich protein [Candidatus Polarisedimenticolaceae bacterium]|nr:CPXCG motif-containing cysteine-rich protein [Candidatus Polarisedimenticolaceae bacterium]